MNSKHSLYVNILSKLRFYINFKLLIQATDLMISQRRVMTTLLMNVLQPVEIERQTPFAI